MHKISSNPPPSTSYWHQICSIASLALSKITSFVKTIFCCFQTKQNPPAPTLQSRVQPGSPHHTFDLSGSSLASSSSNNNVKETQIRFLAQARSHLADPVAWLTSTDIDCCIQICSNNSNFASGMSRFDKTGKDDKATQDWINWGGLDQNNDPTTFSLLSDVNRNHWFCALANHTTKTVYLFDSFNTPDEPIAAIQARATQMSYKFVRVSPKGKKLQQDGYSCGLWCVLFADFYFNHVIPLKIDDNNLFTKFVAFYASKNEDQGKLSNYRQEMLEKLS